VTLRGLYDVTGMRAEADLMMWLTRPRLGGRPGILQKALRALRRTRALADFQAVWSAMGVHREAEFNKRHVPGYLRGEHARGWLCLYPFVRSYEWYLLPEEERSACSPSTAARVRASGGRRQHRLDLRSQRLRVAAAAGERRPHPPRRHDARPARDGRPSPRARGGAVLHGPALEIDELAEVLD
jgi:hypothetical protein